MAKKSRKPLRIESTTNNKKKYYVQLRIQYNLIPTVFGELFDNAFHTSQHTQQKYSETKT